MSKCKPALDGDKVTRIHVRAKSYATPQKTTPGTQVSGDKSKQTFAAASQQSK